MLASSGLILSQADSASFGRVVSEGFVSRVDAVAAATKAEAAASISKYFFRRFRAWRPRFRRFPLMGTGRVVATTAPVSCCASDATVVVAIVGDSSLVFNSIVEYFIYMVESVRFVEEERPFRLEENEQPSMFPNRSF